VAVYKFKTRPMRHQLKALKKFLRHGCGALFAEMGTGKTKIAIDWACALATKENRRLKAAVLCPKSALTVWPTEIRKHDPWGKIPHSGVQWKLVGIDAAWRPYNYDEIVLWKPDIVIVDESSYIKSPGARRSKGAYLLAKRCRYRLIMSGTPIGKNILDLFSQYKVVDDSIFGTSFSVFKREFAIIRAYKVVKWLRMRKFKKKIKPVTFVIKKSQCLDLPERTHEIVPVRFTEHSARIYNTLAEQSIVQFKGMEVMTPIGLTRLLRLSQMCGGWVKGEEYRRLGREKQIQFEAMLDDMMEQDIKKVGVFCRFLPEMGDAARAAQAAGYRALLLHGGVPTKLRKRKIDAFHATEHPTVFIGQTAAGSMAIDLTAASEVIWYSPTPSLIHFLQGCDRYHRIGQTNKVTYYHLLVENSIDYTRIQSLIEKRKMERMVLEDPEIIYNRGVDDLPDDWADKLAELWEHGI
jgi:SNF2 family DNA or RNA helicase